MYTSAFILILYYAIENTVANTYVWCMMGRQDLILSKLEYTTTFLCSDWLSVFSVALVQSVIYT